MYLKISLLLSVILILFSCKKDTDNKEPRITITNPYENQQFTALDTIPVIAEIEDETTLKHINITLTDNNKIPVLNTVSIIPQNKKVNISVPYILDNINLTSGNYYICINASDGINSHYTYRGININGIERKLTYTYIFTYKNSNTIHVSHINSTGDTQQLFDISSDFCSAAICSRHQLFYTAGKSFGDVSAFEVADNSLKWSLPVVSNPPFPYFTNIGCYNDILYVAFYDGFIKAYNNNGSITVTAQSSAGSYPVKLFANSSYLFADHAFYSGSARIFGVYYLVSGALKQFINTNYSVVDIFEKDNDNVFIFANFGGQGIIRLFSISGNGTWEPHTVPSGKINDVLQINENTYIIAHESGLYKYIYNSNSLISFISGINASSVKFDDISSDVYVSVGNKLLIYDYLSHSLINTITTTDSILDFQLLYNK